MASAVRPVLAPFACAAERSAARVDQLRRMLCAAETGLAGEVGSSLALGIPLIDGILGGGLGWGALHEIAAVRETELAAATGFALALTTRSNAPTLPSPAKRVADARERADAGGGLGRGRETIWIAEDLSLAENGAPYGPGIPEIGITPERLLTVTAARGSDVLWAMEEALRCRAVGVVIGELRGRDIDTVATRRLSLAAAAGNTLGLILRAAPDDAPSAAATRWIIGAAPSLSCRNSERSGIDASRLAAHLIRNRRGHLGAWIVEWNSVEQRFVLATHSEPVAGAAVNRSHRAAVA